MINKNKQHINERQKRFADKYLTCGNASEAYRLVYGNKSPRVNVLAKQLMNKPHVQEYIAQRQRKNTEKADISREQLIHLCEEMLRVDVTDLYDGKGQPKDFEKLTEAQKACISEIRHIISGGKLLVVYKTYDKIKLMERISRMLGYDNENVKVTGSVGVHADEPPKRTLEEIKAERERLNKALQAIQDNGK